MSNQELNPDCGRMRTELSAYLYGELAADGTAALEQHLASCASCRDELAGLRETQKLLGRWETPQGGEDPRQLARKIAALARAEEGRVPQARRGRLVRWSAVLSGVAAALLFTLSVFSADVTVSDGGMELRFRLPGTSPTAERPGWDERMHAIATQVVSAQTNSLREAQEELLLRWSRMTREELQQELLRLSQAVDVALAENQRSWDTRLSYVSQEAARNDLEQRRVISDMAAYIVPASNSNR